MIQRISTTSQLRPVIDSLSKITVAGGAFLGENLFANQRVTGARWKALTQRIDVPIPSGNLGKQSWTAKAKFFCKSGASDGKNCEG